MFRLFCLLLLAGSVAAHHEPIVLVVRQESLFFRFTDHGLRPVIAWARRTDTNAPIPDTWIGSVGRERVAVIPWSRPAPVRLTILYTSGHRRVLRYTPDEDIIEDTITPNIWTRPWGKIKETTWLLHRHESN